jgi:hypothetical protein
VNQEEQMSTSITADFEITAWDEAPYDRPEDGPPLSRGTVKKIFRGELEGESDAELLLCQAEDGSAGYVAMERVTGRIGDLSGSFVIQHGGLHSGEGDQTFGYVVPGSGTDGLQGLRGTAAFRHVGDAATLTLTYELG